MIGTAPAVLPSSFAGQRVAIVGLGREGIALTKVLAREGAHILVSDRAPADALATSLAAIADCNVTLNLGGHDSSKVLAHDVLFLSAGVPRTLPLVVEAQRRGLRISSETEFFFSRCPVPITAITGSAGKTTTTTLVGKIMEASGRRVVVAGNIGRAMSAELAGIRSDTCVVLELSSFQLQFLPSSPHVGAMLNVTPNHLDRHADMAEYTEAKRQIFAHQTAQDIAIVNADDPTSLACGATSHGELRSFSLSATLSTARGASVQGGAIVLHDSGTKRSVLGIGELALIGRHNLANAVAACGITHALGAGADSMRAVLTTFAGVEHRLEHVADIGGVRYINDSIATAPERLIAGLEAMTRPTVVLLGGRDKHLPWDRAADLVCTHARAVVTMGEAAALIELALGQSADRLGVAPPILRAHDLVDATQLARAAAHPGDAVLLSPGCTSFDMYRDFEERGRAFKNIVRQLDREEMSA